MTKRAKQNGSLLGKLIRVRWHDHWDGNVWESLAEMRADCVIESVGTVIRETPELLTISAHLDREEKKYGAPTNIWKALVVEEPEVIRRG